MSLLSRMKLLFTSELVAYTFQRQVYESIDDFVHGGGIIMKTIYVPYYDIYIHYYEQMKRFIVFTPLKI